MPKLQSVSSELPDPPYPSDTKANGWKPEIDIRRVKQSRTWKLADPQIRNVLLRLWIESWEEIPCGSFENDDELIASTIDVELGMFVGYRSQIMRGWKLHRDGRLYHPYISGQVLQMLGNRRKNADRVKGWRQKKALENAKCNALPTRDQHVSNTQEQEQEQEQDLSPPISPPSDSSSFSPSSPENTLPATSAFSLPPEVDKQAWADFEAHRLEMHKADKKRNPKLTDLARKQAAGILRKLPREEQRTVVQASIVSGWKGLFPDSKPKDSRKKNFQISNEPTRARLTAL